MDQKLTVQAYIIDELPTPQPALLEATRKCNGHQIFASIFATKIHPQKQGWVQMISQEPILREPQNKLSNEQKFTNACNLLVGIAMLSENGCHISEHNIQDVIGFRGNELKLMAYRFVEAKHQQDKKQQKREHKREIGEVLKYGFEQFFPQQCQQATNTQKSIWKWAYFTADGTFEPSVSPVLQSFLDKKELNKENDMYLGFSEDYPNLPQFVHLDTNLVSKFKEMFKKCLSPFPELRPSLKQLVTTCQALSSELGRLRDHSNIDFAKQTFKAKYLRKIEKAGEELSLNIPEDQTLILTPETKKKLSAGFLRISGKNIKGYTALYRATLFEFDSSIFYAKASGKANLLFCIETAQNGNIFAFICPEMSLAQEKGLQGRFLVDESGQSFIYSSKLQQFSKIAIKQKAYKSSPTFGPIIGDGDIMLGNNKHSNYSFFPKSFEPIKKKHLIQARKGSQKETWQGGRRFTVINYDVYQVSFKK